MFLTSILGKGIRDLLQTYIFSDFSALSLLKLTYGQLASYGGGAGGGGGGGGPNDFGGGGGDYDSGGSLEETIPGTPGVDYPILAEVPETGFSCDGQVKQDSWIDKIFSFPSQAEGGKYADPDAQCQVFHFCALGDTEGGLITYSFLCPNGTIFNQQYLICDWWFNVDCSQAASQYGINDEVLAEGIASNGNTGGGGGGGDYSSPGRGGGGGGGGGGASRPQTGYGAPGK